MTIIERDIEFYESEIERLNTEKRRCVSSKEIDLIIQCEAARKVIIALRYYKTCMERTQ